MVIDDGGVRESLVDKAMDCYLRNPNVCHCDACARVIRGYFSRKSVVYLTEFVEREEDRA